MQRRVVVTGAGVISPLGSSPAALHRALTSGRRAQAIADFDPKAHFGARNARPLDRIAQLVCAAAGLALADGGCSLEQRRDEPVGLVLGTMFAGVRTICAFDRRALELGPEYASPLDFANTVLNAPAGQAAIWHNLRGPNATVSAGAASGLQAIAYAADLIASGAAETVLAGGADERAPEIVDALGRAGLLAPDGAPAMPFAAEPAGVTLGEGAAFVLLESADAARARGAAVRAEILGLASGHAMGRDGVIDDCLLHAVFLAALNEARTAPDDVDVVSAAANGHPGVDAAEARALGALFAGRERPVAVMAMKAWTGETLGASGALQTIAVLEAARSGCLAGIDDLFRLKAEATNSRDVTNSREAVRVRTALVDAVGFDGHCCAVVVGGLGNPS